MPKKAGATTPRPRKRRLDPHNSEITAVSSCLVYESTGDHSLMQLEMALIEDQASAAAATKSLSSRGSEFLLRSRLVLSAGCVRLASCRLRRAAD